MDFVAAVAESANIRGLDVLLLTAENGYAEIERVVASAMVDGLILMDVDLHDDRITLVAELDKPAVLIGMPDQPDGLTYVDLDFAAAGRLCARHLVDMGHEKIGLLGCSSTFYEHEVAFVHRSRAGVFDVLRAYGLPELFETVEPDPTGIEDALRSLFDTEPELTALVIHNDMAIAGVLDALKRSFREVPRDLSVVAICPEDLARQQLPELTFVALPAATLGTRAVELLVAQQAGADVTSELFAPELVGGGSTVPPRRYPRQQP
jgi:DNA-binding LacI/PurR family transcriptional regulator